MPESRRIEKVNKLIKKEIAGIIDREINFEENILVTITRVDAHRNLSEAKIYLSVLPQENQDSALKNLNDNIYKLQQSLNKELNMRPVPKISFHLDKGQAQAEEVYKIFNQ
jgi:ribosome-binding factor A